MLFPLALSLLLVACGGSDNSPPVVAPSPSPPVVDPLAPAAALDLSSVLAQWEIDPAGVGGDAAGDGGAAGAAGDGSPLKRARVILVDAQGKSVSGTTDEKGHYLLKFKTAEFKPPYVVKVLDAEGNVLAAGTEQAVTSGQVTRVNINPLTDKATSDALTNVKGTDREFSGAQIDISKLALAKANVNTSVRAALAVAGVTNSDLFDPVRSVYKYDGTGVDAVIESISHVRNPESGATELRAKLAPLTTNPDGTVVPTLITASTPLATTQVAISSNPALTFQKITAWVNRFNECLALPTGTQNANCNDAAFDKMISPLYKHNSKDFEEDFRAMCSEADGACVSGTEFRNPNILFHARTAGSDVDNAAVVEITVRQPRTGPMAGNSTTPVEYTKYLVFRRDDTQTGLIAGNWILLGNQRNFDWSVEPQYYTFQQANSKYNSITVSGIRFGISTLRYNPATRTYVDTGAYAARVTGPGLPANGVVYAITSTVPNATNMTILNKTGQIPAIGTRSSRPQSDFRLAGVNFPSGTPIPATNWSGTPSGANLPHYLDVQLADFSALQAYNVYTVEFYVQGAAQPIVETSRILAGISSPGVNVSRPLHDLSPNLGLITPPQPATSSVTLNWLRNPLSVRIESAFFIYNGSFATSRSVPDINAVTQTSTSITMPVSQGQAPATDATTPNQAREVGLNGRAARARYGQSLVYAN
jgi:hypothetical protein